MGSCHSFMSLTAITLKFKMCLFLEEAKYCAEKLLTDINLPSLVPDEDNNLGGPLILKKMMTSSATQEFPSFSRGISGHVTCLDQGTRERKYMMDYDRC